MRLPSDSLIVQMLEFLLRYTILPCLGNLSTYILNFHRGGASLALVQHTPKSSFDFCVSSIGLGTAVVARATNPADLMPKCPPFFRIPGWSRPSDSSTSHWSCICMLFTELLDFRLLLQHFFLGRNTDSCRPGSISKSSSSIMARPASAMVSNSIKAPW